MLSPESFTDQHLPEVDKIRAKLSEYGLFQQIEDLKAVYELVNELRTAVGAHLKDLKNSK